MKHREVDDDDEMMVKKRRLLLAIGIYIYTLYIWCVYYIQYIQIPLYYVFGDTYIYITQTSQSMDCIIDV